MKDYKMRGGERGGRWGLGRVLWLGMVGMFMVVGVVRR